MVIRRVLASPNGCNKCRLALLKAFVPNAIIPARSLTASSSIGYNSRRSIITSDTRQSSLINQRRPNGPRPSDGASLETSARLDNDGATDPTASEPWYLQVETPRQTPSPLLQRQQIPELPPNPPPLLGPLLEHISIELGLDDLTVIDLRNISPPPALGANLLMILGTARTEKHLHVSADRFCRWLKATHKLSPYADGLLGRGELKLKLRRKARRAKLLSNVGSSETGKVDDGIRTGWICVNIGTIDDGKRPAENLSDQEGYVGFGWEAGGAKVVIQMLTGEKREELDLEGLWDQVQRRQERKDARILGGKEELLIHQEVGQSAFSKDHRSSDVSTPLPRSHSKLPTINFNQTRCYHEQPVSPAESADAWEESRGSLKKTAKLEYLRALVDHVKRLPSQDAIRLLGNGEHDFDSTLFLKAFYTAYPLFPNADHWECRLAIVCYGIKLGHSGYTKKHLEQLASRMQSSLVEIPARVLALIYKTILTPNPNTIRKIGRSNISLRSIYVAMDILEAMSLRSHPILTEEIQFDLLVASIRVKRQQLVASALRKDGHQRLKKLFDSLLNQSPTLENHIRLLHEYAEQSRWSDFHDYWRQFARDMRPRPKELYVVMFKRVAQRKQKANTMQILRECIPEMDREQPAVALDAELAEVVMDCLLVAEPFVEILAMQESNFDQEWVKLWRRCQRALQKEAVGNREL